HYFKFSFEAERLALVKMNVGDVRRGHRFEVLVRDFLFEVPGNHVFENFLPDAALELFFDQRWRRFSRTEAGELGPFLKILNYTAGFHIDHLGGNRDFKGMLAAFY